MCDRFVYYRGLPKVVYYQAKGFLEIGYEVKIWTSLYDFPTANFEYETVPLPKFKIPPRTIKLPDDEIIISHSSLLGNYFLVNENFYFVYHGYPPWRINPAYPIFTLVMIPQIHRAKVIIAISKYCKDELRRRFLADSVVVYNGIDTEFFKPLSVAKEYDICSLRRIERRKNMKQTQAILPNVKWAYKLPEKELPLFYNKAKLYVNLSEWEGFGLDFVEAMGCGVPVIGLNSSAIPEIVGDGGIICKSLNEVKGAINNLLTDEIFYDHLSVQARKRVTKYFDYRDKIKQLLTIFKV